MKNFILLLLVSAFFVHTAQASDLKNDLLNTCSKINDVSAYVENDLKAYSTLSQGLDGYIFRTKADYMSDFTLTDPELENLKTLSKKFAQKNVHLIIFFQPTRGMVHYDKISDADKITYEIPPSAKIWAAYDGHIDQLKNEGVDAIGITRAQASTAESYFYKKDHHWSAGGAKVSAQAIAEHIKTLAIYPSFTKSEFASVRKKTVPYQGRFSKVFETLCGTKLAPELAETYETNAKSSGNASELFTIEAGVDIVLLGTSNSASKKTHANFDGFLREAIGVNVLNMAKTGGWIDESLLEYLASESFKAAKPKLIIWEMPVHYNFKKADAMFAKAFSELDKE